MTEIRIQIKEITDTSVILMDGTEYKYIEKRKVIQRTDHDRLPADYCDGYILERTYDTIYVYKNKWAYYKKLKEVSENYIMYLIEKDKQLDRIGDKYKHLKMTDTFSLRQFFPIYQDITEACDRAYDDFITVFKQLKISKWKKYPLWRWIEGSKLADYHYNYLFTEYFEEEAN